MEYSSCVYNNTPEDSGLGESSRNESNSNSLYTPTTSFVTSRKRKIIDQQSLKSADLKQTPNVDSIESSPWIKNSEILSSTLNDSITTGVENCKLIENYNCSYYVETSNNNLKDIKEPSTPEKSSSTKRYCTSPRMSPMLKLGSPERNDILYPNRSNLARLSESKRCSPAKKNLFPSNARKDPVVFFSRERACSHVTYKIFLSLCDGDLYTCSKVSPIWRREIANNERLKKRLQMFKTRRIMNKENNCEFPLVASQMKQSTPIQALPMMYEITNSLTEDQHLEKCLFCGRPVAVVERNISQCTSPKCGAIRCLNCNSISKTGPKDFVNKCQQSTLLLDKPSSRLSLLDSPKRYQNTEGGIPTFLLNDSLNTSQTFNSSGYLTDGELNQTATTPQNSSSFTIKDKEKADMSRVLKNCNSRVLNRLDKNWEVRNSILPVISVARQREEIIEPSSPPKVKHVAGSKKSKKMLKRLNL
ncbi:hypothetical protein MML48_9g00011468 [Holotrichia oblita]|uniref:Uncharacterized protein n=1 Tax=Holotrichia oblita TaxID=644536 RepID=A0ACB9SMJ9_HOLOL|nr:hypothetical protein MML48_9g00011468 [Holotrichia oblita]